MNVDKLFAAWWLMFGQHFRVKLGFVPTDKEMARYAFEAGVKAGQSLVATEEEQRTSHTELTLENGAKVKIGIDRPDALLIQVEEGYAIQALPHEDHYIVLQVKLI